MMKALFVDDQEEMLELARFYLRSEGIELESTTDPEVAFAAILGGGYDVVISDYLMEGMNGIDLLKRLRDAGNDTPFIIFTGKGREEVAIDALNHGADFYLQKNGSADEGFAALLSKIRMLAKMYRSEDMDGSDFDGLFQGSGIPMFVHDHDTGRLLDVNRAAWEAHGCTSRQELLSKKIWNEPPYMMPDALVMFEEARKLGRSEGEWKFTSMEHEDRWFKVVMEKVLMGGESRIILYSFDITDRVRKSMLMRAQLEMQKVLATTSDMNDVLQVSLRMAQEVSGLSCGGIYLVQADSSLEMVHHQGLQEEFRRMIQSYAPSSPNHHAVMMGQAFFTNYEDFAAAQGIEGRFKDIKALAILPFSAEGRVIGAIILGSTYLETVPEWSQSALLFIAAETGLAVSRGRVMEENKNQRTNLKRLFSGVKDPIFVVGLDGSILSCNQAALDTLGYAEEELLGGSVLQAHPPERKDEVLGVVQGMIEGSITHCTIPLCRKNGTYVPVETNVTKGMWDGREVIFGISRDLTEINAAEDSLRNLNHKLGLLSSITRHDIRNQLMVLRGYLDVAGAEEDPHAIRTYLSRAERALNNIQISIDKAKEYEELGSKRPEWQSPSECLRSCAARMDLQSVRLTVAAEDWQVNADPMLPKVFHNLLENSLFHGGHVSSITFTAKKEGGNLVMVYQDDGKGIDERTRQWLFTKGRGHHGFGMFLSKEILALTGITIEEKGEPGKGARFVLTVPSGNFRAAS